jgi:hypothetical protein
MKQQPVKLEHAAKVLAVVVVAALGVFVWQRLHSESSAADMYAQIKLPTTMEFQQKQTWPSTDDGGVEEPARASYIYTMHDSLGRVVPQLQTAFQQAHYQTTTGNKNGELLYAQNGRLAISVSPHHAAGKAQQIEVMTQEMK